MKKIWQSKTMWACFFALVIGIAEKVQAILPEYFDSAMALMICGIVMGIARTFKSNLGLK